ncbi:WD40 repeat domain-containing protein, partial [Actinomycetota bacterium Odt1-20B]
LVLIAAGIAVWQRQNAEAEAQRALSRQLAAQSAALVDSSPDLASLLAVEAYRTEPTAEATASLYRAVSLPLRHRFPRVKGGGAYMSQIYDRQQDTDAFTLPMTVSHNGRTAAVAGFDGVDLRNTATGRRVRTFETHMGIQQTMAFNHEDRILAVANSHADMSPRNQIQLRDIRTGETVRTLTGTEHDNFEELMFSADGRTLASGTSYGRVRLWDVRTSRSRSQVEGYSKLRTGMAFSPDLRYVAMSSKAGELSLWSLTGGSEQMKISGKSDPPASALAFSPDSRILATGLRNGAVQLRRVADGKLIRTALGRSVTSIRALAFSPDGGAIAVANDDGTVTLHDSGTGRLLGTVAAPEQGQGTELGFGARNDTLIVNTSKNLRSYDLSAMRPRATLSRSAGYTGALALSGDGKRLFTVSKDGGTQLWDVVRGKALTARGPEQAQYFAYLATFDSAESPLAVGFGDQQMLTWDAASGTIHGRMPRDRSEISDLSLSPDGRLLAAGERSVGERQRVVLWDAGSGKRLQDLMIGKRSADALTFSPDGRALAVGRGREGTQLWDTARRKRRATLPEDVGEGLAFSADGQTLATATPGGSSEADGVVRLWDIPGARVRATLNGHTRHVVAAVFSQDGRTLATAGSDGTVRLWDAATGLPRATLTTPEGSPSSVALTPDSRTLVIGTNSGDISVWRVDLPTPEEAIEKICRAVGRRLTAAERATYAPGSEPHTECHS